MPLSLLREAEMALAQGQTAGQGYLNFGYCRPGAKKGYGMVGLMAGMRWAINFYRFLPLSLALNL
jgi:hypothetical protein